MHMTPSAMPPPSFVIAGFWRRLCALLIDLLMLGVLGWIIGEVFFEPLARLGNGAKIIGFAMALAYFGICNSRVAGGQTLAKRWLGLRVVDARGHALSLPRAIVRYVILGLPYFASGMAVGSDSLTNTVLAYVLALFLSGGQLAIIYLYLFNRRTRQSLHDLVVGSYVVQAQPAAQAMAFASIWRGHFVVVAVLALQALASAYAVSLFAHSKMFAGILPLYRTLSAQPHVISAQVARGSLTRDGETTRSIQATLRLDAPLTGDSAMAKQIAQLLAKGDPEIVREDSIDVTLTHGFTLGIASGWRKQVYSFKPGELK